MSKCLEDAIKSIQKECAEKMQSVKNDTEKMDVEKERDQKIKDVKELYRGRMTKELIEKCKGAGITLPLKSNTDYWDSNEVLSEQYHWLTDRGITYVENLLKDKGGQHLLK
ncbi:MAG: hypothetical protein KKH94_03630 [Candidatus Omnitrophica bacterium]|nr:hypothetical protein [Candidatus Omnitrophota bacterium]